MADKEQIIIDGVDVSKCEDFSIGYSSGSLDKYRCNLDSTVAWSLNCKDNFNCYYKQLARKTQECEEMKEKLRELELKNTTLQNRNQQLDGSTTKSDRYRKALEEIKNIIISENVSIRPKLYDFEQDNKILDIINKTKE